MRFGKSPSIPIRVLENVPLDGSTKRKWPTVKKRVEANQLAEELEQFSELVKKSLTPRRLILALGSGLVKRCYEKSIVLF